ncbi:MAG: hypothetical protein D6759_17530 [Chloroflexi bacterium]|nr:MAG: hypothetical protein D6759_17530 [Chloroflexota bacterium]
MVSGPGRHHRVVRGGSWNNNQRNARCAYRNRNDPDNFNNNLGLRVVVSIARRMALLSGRAADGPADPGVHGPRAVPEGEPAWPGPGRARCPGSSGRPNRWGASKASIPGLRGRSWTNTRPGELPHLGPGGSWDHPARQKLTESGRRVDDDRLET